MKCILFVWQLWALGLLHSADGDEDGTDRLSYGVDVSYPMHHATVSTNYPWLPHNQQQQDEGAVVPDEYKGMPLQPLGNRQAFHDAFMEGCGEQYERGHCDVNERERVAMSLRQPECMRNYTRTGFTKIRAPEHVFKLLQDFWHANRNNSRPERWSRANIYTNHWEAPSTMISVEDPSMKGGGIVLKRHIWNAARDTIQEWTGQRLVECSLYGIRIYPTGAVLATHVDRLPLVSSAIVNVDQDVDEPWPLEVIGHDGVAHNVTMVPGDLVLYESHSVLHGRPFPLKGRFMANVFIHFEPIGPMGGQIEYTGDLPPYVIPGSAEETRWRRQHPKGHVLHSGQVFETGSTDAHTMAANNQFGELRDLLDGKDGSKLINIRDQNGWTPLHEAVRAGDVDVVRLLLERGANANIRTGANGDGGSPLYWAHKYHGDGKNLFDYEQIETLLKEYDGRMYRPAKQTDEL